MNEVETAWAGRDMRLEGGVGERSVCTYRLDLRGVLGRDDGVVTEGGEAVDQREGVQVALAHLPAFHAHERPTNS